MELKKGDIIERTSHPYGDTNYFDTERVTVDYGTRAEIVEVRVTTVRARILEGLCKGEVHTWRSDYFQPVCRQPNWEV